MKMRVKVPISSAISFRLMIFSPYSGLGCDVWRRKLSPSLAESQTAWLSMSTQNRNVLLLAK
jgi:hypothetical protein